MKKDTLIVALGVVVVVAPFLGFPGGLETALSVAAGIGIVISILLMRREMLDKPFSLKKHFERRADSFVENSAPLNERRQNGFSSDRVGE